MIYSEELLNKLHQMSYANRPLVERSTVCGCFHCGAIYSPNIIDPETDYCIDSPYDTATCPYCWIDSVICDSMEVEITPELLEEMHQEFFSDTLEMESSVSETDQEESDERLERVLFPCNGAPSGDTDDVCVVIFKDGSHATLKATQLNGALGPDDESISSIVHALPFGTGVTMYVTLLDETSKVIKWDYRDNSITVWNT